MDSLGRMRVVFSWGCTGYNGSRICIYTLGIWVRYTIALLYTDALLLG
jgi:hypothetical protein